MEDRIISYLNCMEEFPKKISTYMEAFVKYYGEEYRKEIEEKFSKAIFLGYYNPDSLQTILTTLEKSKTKVLMQEVLKDSNPSLEEELVGDYYLEYRTLQPLYKIYVLYQDYCKGKEGREKEFIKEGYEFLKRHDPDLTMDDYQKMFQENIMKEKYNSSPSWLKNNIIYFIDKNSVEIEYQKKYSEAEPFLKKYFPQVNKDNFEELFQSSEFKYMATILERYEKAIQEYDNSKEKVQSFYEEKERLSRLKTKLYSEAYKQLIMENIDFIPDDIKSGIEDDRNKKRSFDDYNNKLFGTSIMSTSLIEYFTDEMDEELTKENPFIWKVDEIKKNRIAYFQLNGINLGEKYEDYLENEEVKKIWPSKERINDFIASKKRIISQMDEKYYTNSNVYQEIRKRIEQKRLLDKDDSLTIDNLFVKEGTFVGTNLIETENGYELFSTVVVNFNDVTGDDKDHFIVHELNHLFELELKSIVGNEYETICGWDIITSHINQKEGEVKKEKPNEKRPYELFNEIINELIAQEISKIMHDNNMYVFDDKDNSTYKNTTSYEHSLFLIEDFYNEFKDTILKSRRHGNIDAIFKEVGKENFDELNRLFEIYFNHFSEFKIYGLIDSLKKKEDNELTRVYYDLCDRRDRILEKMRMVSQQSKNNNYSLN